MSDRSNVTGDAAHDDSQVTSEVGGEGGSPGDVEIAPDTGPATGSEAGETSKPAPKRGEAIIRDETGVGRRSP
jgi:hypothetical protein